MTVLPRDEIEEYSWIDDADRIPGYLEKAARESEHIEVQINNRSRVFFTFFAENGSEPSERWEESSLIELDQSYFDYLKDGECLHFTPVLPQEGNETLQKGDQFLFRFFVGVNAIEGWVTFEDMVWSRQGNQVIRTSFPTRLRLNSLRRHFRAKVPTTLPLNCRVEAPGMTPINAKVLDLSVGGISLRAPLTPEEMPTGREVTLTLEAPELPHLRLRAYARCLKPMVSRRSDTLALLTPHHYQSGFQFDLPTVATEAQVGQFVVLVQRESLKARCRIRNRNRPPQEKISCKKRVAKEMSRFLGRLRLAAT